MHPAEHADRAIGEELTLSFDQQTWLNAISGEPVITGTLECPAVAQRREITVEATQEENGSYGYGATTLECDAAEVRWLINLDGDFETGLDLVGWHRQLRDRDRRTPCVPM